jgi:uncharacterized protein
MSGLASTRRTATEMATRRAFLAGMAAATIPRLSWADAGSPAYLAAGKLGEGYRLHGLGAGGESLFHIALPARGHAAAAHPDRPLAVAFARRPGTFALVLNCVSGTVSAQLTPPAGRQFNGHGAFSLDGSLLMTSEVVAEGSAGRIGLWEVPSFRRIGEWETGGIGPHDIKRLADGRLVVANGGIQTDPGDRTKLNIAAMRPSLSLLSPQGEILDQVRLEEGLHQNSIRHLALVGDGVAFAMQWEGDRAETVPLLGLWSPGAPVGLCPAPEAEAPVMQGYAGSIAANAGLIALTSPKGGAVMVFTEAGDFVTTHRHADLSGAAAGKDGFVLSDGQGAIWQCDVTALLPAARHDTLWDNHLIAL